MASDDSKSIGKEVEPQQKGYSTDAISVAIACDVLRRVREGTLPRREPTSDSFLGKISSNPAKPDCHPEQLCQRLNPQHMAMPGDDELAVMYRCTLHTRWGVGGFMGVGGEDNFSCRCESCTSTRRNRWLKEMKSD